MKEVSKSFTGYSEFSCGTVPVRIKILMTSQAKSKKKYLQIIKSNTPFGRELYNEQIIYWSLNKIFNK